MVSTLWARLLMNSKESLEVARSLLEELGSPTKERIRSDEFDGILEAFSRAIEKVRLKHNDRELSSELYRIKEELTSWKRQKIVRSSVRSVAVKV